MTKTFELLRRLYNEQDAPILPHVLKRELGDRPDFGRHVPKFEASARAHSIGNVVNQVFRKENSGSSRLVVFASTDAHRATKAICAWTADLLAPQVQGRVCVVEPCDGTQGITGMFGVDGTTVQTLGTDAPLTECCSRVAEGNLWIARTNTSEPRSALTGECIAKRFEELRSEFDFSLIVAPPGPFTTESEAFYRNADGVVLVIDAGISSRERTLEFKLHLDAIGVPVLGAVLHHNEFPIPKALYTKLSSL